MMPDHIETNKHGSKVYTCYYAYCGISVCIAVDLVECYRQMLLSNTLQHTSLFHLLCLVQRSRVLPCRNTLYAIVHSSSIFEATALCQTIATTVGLTHIPQPIHSLPFLANYEQTRILSNLPFLNG
jgi:hypothetical protein